MKNQFLLFFQSKLTLKIEGRNVDRFLRKLIALKIDLLDITPVKRDVLKIKIYAKDYEKVEKAKTIYDISIIDTFGLMRIKRVLTYYRLLFVMLLFASLFLVGLTHIITDVEVIHSDIHIRNLLLDEMQKYGLDRFHIKRSYDQIEEVKKKILNRHKQEIEWLEIENIGTKYIVRVEERKMNQAKEDEKPRNVIAKKSAIIKSIDAESGVIMKEVNSYVEKGEVIVSGEVYLNEELKDVVRASGSIYGEVWYKTTVEFPYLYKEIQYTGREKDVYRVQILSHYIDIFPFSSYSKHKGTAKTLLSHTFLPFRFVKEHQKEVKIKDEIYTIDQAIDKARALATEKMKEKLDKKEYIMSTKDLNVSIKESKIRLEVFFTVYEDITDYQSIDEESLRKKLEIEKEKQG